ncbi:MAG: pyruvate kinase [Verrucomicrobia bacterium]|nr:pyruvate kinase [Verrucomicrobiota bacterium]
MATREVQPRWNAAQLGPLIQELEELRRQLLAAERKAAKRLAAVRPAQRISALNLIHYLALRRRDLRPLQERLSSFGLSSFGHSESHVLDNLNVVLRILRFLAGQPTDRTRAEFLSFERGRMLLEERTRLLLGPARPNRGVRILVTMPSEGAHEPALARQLLEAGMDLLRINCAHDSPSEWGFMVKHLRAAERETGRSCRILFDLGGPKLRTGPVAHGPAVRKWRPVRDALGRAVQAARLWLTPEDAPELVPDGAAVELPLKRSWLERLKVGETVRLVDARKNRRQFKIVAAVGASWWAESRQTAYVTSGTELVADRPGEKKKHRRVRLGDLPASEQPIALKTGELLLLTADLRPGTSAQVDDTGTVVAPARIGCSHRAIFKCVQPGERIWFDDGKIGGVVERVTHQELQVRITWVRAKGGKLRADKGINLPDTALRLSALTPKDIRDLTTIEPEADLVGYSFVRSPEDVRQLQKRLERVPRSLGIILKIETRAAFERLPELLLAAMRSPKVGVMIARGDLAVECGYERLAEVQEEILWMCEAAHVPVIWATQVLETMAQDGQPSRAEVTDAAMGVRAECVMLNKGPEMVATVRALDDILTRMQAHQNKKQSMLRSLNVARLFHPESGAGLPSPRKL